MAIQTYQKHYEGASFTTERDGIMVFYALKDGLLNKIRLRIKEPNPTSNLTFTLTKNNVAYPDIVIPMGSIETDLDVADDPILLFDVFVLNLTEIDSGQLTTPLALQLEVEEEFIIDWADIDNAPTFQLTSEKNQANGYAGLGGDSKIDPAQLPTLAINSIQNVANQAARLALTDVQEGDAVKELDTLLTYVLAVLPANNNANWISISDLSPDWSVITNKPTTSGIPEGLNFYYTDVRTRNTVLTGLSVASATVVTAAHKLLEAIGFLQAQVSLKAPLFVEEVVLTVSTTALDSWSGKKIVFNATGITLTLPDTLSDGFHFMWVEMSAGNNPFDISGSSVLTNVDSRINTGNQYATGSITKINGTPHYILSGVTQ